jgi:hypothetical protein
VHRVFAFPTRRGAWKGASSTRGGGDVAGVRFNAYALDFGRYVDLFNTKKAPARLFATEDEAGNEVYAEVPQDDCRSIRRAILDLGRLERHLQTRGV